MKKHMSIEGTHNRQFMTRSYYTALLCFYMMIAGCVTTTSYSQSDQRASETVPLAGNSFLTQGESGRIGNNGIVDWEDEQSVFSIYFKVSDSASTNIGLRARVEEGTSTLGLEINGVTHTSQVSSQEFTLIDFGEYELDEQGYTRIDISGVNKTGSIFAEISEVVLRLPTGISTTYVKENTNNRFYWGRRGPSVHLRYEMPEDRDIEWFYNEVTVPIGEDPVGSFFMANGFGQGYFGIQVNSETERRILFSVWSPYQTDNPDEIPENQRIQVLDKGEDVYTGEFGNEGSGGQSYLRYPWEAGKTYRFLNGVRPDGNGNTVYTAYFYSPDEGEWHLIAQFLRPQTDTWYTNAHSFLESFAVTNGYRGRRANYMNQWVRDSDGHWIELTDAVFTGDDIARTGYRLDFSGGVSNGSFFLRNCGFYVGDVPLDSRFQRSDTGAMPDIDISLLP